MIRELLITEKPDGMIIFTDPRQFIWLWEMEDEIHQVCPVAYWHVWDNDPYPAFNQSFYESTDLINCLSKKTYDLVKPEFPEKTNYIPHSFPKDVFFPIEKVQLNNLALQNFGERAGWFKVLWINRNATRKVPNDVLNCFNSFLTELEKKHGHRNAMLVMHTNPKDPEGPDLINVTETLRLQNNVVFSADAIDFEKMNILQNLCDTCINISKNEGFGLMTLSMMQVGKPIIALCTGGETSQVIDPVDGSEHGAAIKPCKRLLVGSQLVPYIYEDYAADNDVVEALMKVYELVRDQDRKEAMSQKVMSFVDREFSYDKMVSEWDKTLDKLLVTWHAKQKENLSNWKFVPIDPHLTTEEENEKVKG